MFTYSERTPDGDTILMSAPGFDAHNNENTNGDDFEGPTQHAYEDPFDDVFGSAPGSPVLTNQDHAAADSQVASRHPHLQSRPQDPSDIPRLRSIHVTNGYREGMTIGKERSLQAGFDEGYALGAEFGVLTGWISGVLEGLLSTVPVEAHHELQQLIDECRIELDMNTLFGTDFFDQDGVWKYDLQAQAGTTESSVTFREVAAAHPRLLKWRQLVIETATQHGVVLS